LKKTDAYSRTFSAPLLIGKSFVLGNFVKKTDWAKFLGIYSQTHLAQ
jgi:hypothetical protein